MRTTQHLIAFMIFSLGLSSKGFADWSSRNKLELGMTDNALLAKTDKESDLFIALSSRNSFTINQHTLGMRLGYRDYNKENSNDALSWGLSDKLSCWTDKACEFEIRGQEYVYGEPMTTDSSFSNYGAVVSVEKSRSLAARTTLDLTTSYEFRNYNSLNRTDHSLSEFAVLGYDFAEDLYGELIGEVGLALSSSSEFSSYHFSLSALMEYQLDRLWTLAGELGFKQTHFLSRDLTTETLVTKKNGQVVSLIDTSKEVYSALFFTLEANREISSRLSTGISLQTYQQKSRSGYQDYNENIILGKFLVNF